MNSNGPGSDPRLQSMSSGVLLRVATKRPKWVTASGQARHWNWPGQCARCMTRVGRGGRGIHEELKGSVRSHFGARRGRRHGGVAERR
jgi:hypothetical protein